MAGTIIRTGVVGSTVASSGTIEMVFVQFWVSWLKADTSYHPHRVSSFPGRVIVTCITQQIVPFLNPSCILLCYFDRQRSDC